MCPRVNKNLPEIFPTVYKLLQNFAQKKKIGPCDASLPNQATLAQTSQMIRIYENLLFGPKMIVTTQ